LVTQKDHGFWQQQTGGPSDPQPGNVPGGRRDVLRGADFNNGQLQGFAVDSGVWQVSSGTLSVAAASQGKDAAAVFYADAYLPIYYEIVADVTVQKPNSGWKGNAYVLFDYFSPTDFKFAGIDISTNKMVIGHRNVTGWITDYQRPFNGQLKSNTAYNQLIAINGTVVTVSINGSQAFSYTFAPRILDGEAVGLNKGLVGIGSDNSRGIFDNVVVQALPPALTLDVTEDFNDGLAQQFTGDQTGTWTAAGGRYASTAASGVTAIDCYDYGLGHGLQPTSYVEVQATLKTGGIGGIVFDEYATNDFKFVALDVAAQKVVVGHVEPRRGWVIDQSVNKSLVTNTNYSVQLVINGPTVSVTVGGSLVTSYAYNSPAADGAVGVLSRSGTTSFDSYRIRTNDPAFATAPLMATASIAGSEPVSSKFYDPRDVNRDGHVSPSDVLLIINYLNAFGGGGGQATVSHSSSAEALDVNGDSFLAPNDALEVINYINAHSASGGEGEAADAYFDDVAQSRDAADELWMILASDTATVHNKRR